MSQKSFKLDLNTKIRITSIAKQSLGMYIIGLNEQNLCFDLDYFLFSKKLSVHNSSASIELGHRSPELLLNFNFPKASIEGVHSFIILVNKKKAKAIDAFPLTYSFSSEHSGSVEEKMLFKNKKANTVMIGRVFYSSNEKNWYFEEKVQS